MQEPEVKAVVPTANVHDNQFEVVDLLIVLAKHKKAILGFPVLAALIAVGISFALPNVYRASTKLLPPQQAQSGTAALLSQLGGVAGLAAGAAGLKSPNEMYVSMIKSRVVADKLIGKYDLRKEYNLDSLEKTRDKLEENTVVTSGKDGLIIISVDGEDQNLVAKLANSYVSELISLTRVLALTESSQRRLFFERQLELAKNNLATAEVKLKQALDSRGVISVDSESRAIVETVGRLRAQASAKEIQLSSMSAFVTSSNPEYRRVAEELSSLRAELSRLENGRAPDSSPSPDKTLEKTAGLENIKVLRDVKYYQMLYELLAKQYEAARLDEAKESTIIQVLDPAITPERKFKPKRALIVMLTALAVFLISVVGAFLVEGRKRFLKNAPKSPRISELRSHMRFK
jgi:uncharacterized protein involved in exopolysaccharide biosynthesis